MNLNLIQSAYADSAPAVPAVPAGSGLAAGTQAVPAGAPPAAGASGQPSFLASFAPILIMFGILYFLMIRPQQKKQKDQQELLKGLKNGDEVVTASGILGRIAGLTEKVVTLEIADNVKMKMLRSQISQVVKGPIKDPA